MRFYLEKLHLSADMANSVEEDGLNAIDFSVMNSVLKLNWLNSFTLHKNSFWLNIPDEFVFNGRYM